MSVDWSRPVMHENGAPVRFMHILPDGRRAIQRLWGCGRTAYWDVAENGTFQVGTLGQRMGLSLTNEPAQWELKQP